MKIFSYFPSKLNTPEKLCLVNPYAKYENYNVCFVTPPTVMVNEILSLVDVCHHHHPTENNDITKKHFTLYKYTRVGSDVLPEL